MKTIALLLLCALIIGCHSKPTQRELKRWHDQDMRIEARAAKHDR